MSSAIAKKYVNALMKGCTNDELVEISNELSTLSHLFSLDKFNNIVLSPHVSKHAKAEFVVSLLTLKNVKLTNFVKLLNNNDRLKLIPSIADELKYQLALKNNKFVGTISTSFAMNERQIKLLEDNFSKKFGASISLKNSVNAYPGIKVELDDLGIEVRFSLERLKAQMSEHILKAI
ncbi:F0F1 ATP synthase subunit delta [Sulfurospirillum deleyianum]|uniref:ATP synthase subunit delta n=1 Tax=Sulfurospirillum deleyianum (strain ATCC 51133 / DSM 6946 / 5175) TaxID=525898 RepID=D1AZT2_SULD5|nr:F0F1 ATP synthase subunit delta [Sulfurospirillum deleyianum]ACZ11549.1 ATP synthase F1, delta subunit [Sulfurospirillum deleyianum DSM 6946]